MPPQKLAIHIHSFHMIHILREGGSWEGRKIRQEVNNAKIKTVARRTAETDI